MHLFLQIPNRELLHGVIGLYDVSLSEMTPDVLYTSVCDKQAKTIVLLRDIKGINMSAMFTLIFITYVHGEFNISHIY